MELPFQTYERLTCRKWPGGNSEEIAKALKFYGIEYRPGTAEANLCLQGAMLCASKTRLYVGTKIATALGALVALYTPPLPVSEGES